MNSHKHWVKRPISEVRRYIAKIIKKTTRTTREQLKLNCPKLSRLSLYIKAMLLEIEAMLLAAEVMLLSAEGLPLHAEVMLLRFRR